MAESVLPSRYLPSGGGAVSPNTFRTSFVQSIAGSSAITVQGFAAPTPLGTTSAKALTNVSSYTRRVRVTNTSGATAGSLAGFRLTGNFLVAGESAQFTFAWGAADATTVAGARSFVGLRAATTFDTTDPSTLPNLVGVGADTGDANLSIITNDATGTATKISLGSGFPANTQSADYYKLVLSIASGAITYTVTNGVSGATATGTLTTDLPVAGSLMNAYVTRGNGTTASAVVVDFMYFNASWEY